MAGRSIAYVLASMLALVASGCAGYREVWLYVTEPAGQLTSNRMWDESQAVRAQASIDLACPRASLEVHARGYLRFSNQYLAEGCGARRVYVSATYGAVLTSVPEIGESSASSVAIELLVGITEHTPEDLARFRAECDARPHVAGATPSVVTPGLETSGVMDYYDLGIAAARELSCPFDQLTLEVNERRSNRTYMAEGCGVRAVFQRSLDGHLVLTSRVSS